MTSYEPSDWNAVRLFVKVLRPFAELGLVVAVLWFASPPWWAYVLLALISIPYLTLRLRDVRDEWNS